MQTRYERSTPFRRGTLTSRYAQVKSKNGGADWRGDGCAKGRARFHTGGVRSATVAAQPRRSGRRGIKAAPRSLVAQTWPRAVAFLTSESPAAISERSMQCSGRTCYQTQPGYIELAELTSAVGGTISFWCVWTFYSVVTGVLCAAHVFAALFRGARALLLQPCNLSSTRLTCFITRQLRAGHA